MERHHVVIVGGGFGGLHAAQRLRRMPVDVTLVDRRNFHLFQPLTYQVATGALSPGDVAYPLRAVFKRHGNIRVWLGEVSGFDVDGRQVLLADGGRLPYDTLIVAAGSSYGYFGHDDWARHALEVKTLESATAVRSRLLLAFERAEREPPGPERDALLTFVVVGAGPTGVEMAGQIGELARDTLRGDFRTIDPREAVVLLVDTLDRVLVTFPKSLSARAARSLERLGVTLRLGAEVVGVDAEGVTYADGSRTPARTVVWAAGVQASGLASQLGEAAGAPVDRAGRVTVRPDLTLPGHPEVMLVGDIVRLEDTTLLGVAPEAIQQGRHAAEVVKARVDGTPLPPFRYHDKGNVATIGRNRAVADLGWIRISGFPAWLLWVGVHLFYLIGFRNRVLVGIQWAISWVTRGRGARLITNSAPAGAAPGAQVGAGRVEQDA